MDAFDDTLTAIVEKIQASALTDEEKADAYAALSGGLYRLVWPLLVSSIPESELKNAVDHPETLTVKRYGELMGMALDNPDTTREIHKQVMGALGEIEELVASLTSSPYK